MANVLLRILAIENKYVGKNKVHWVKKFNFCLCKIISLVAHDALQTFMLLTIATCHCPFLCTDYSMPVSSCPPSGLSFLSCNDEISLDFRLLKHDSIIVKEMKNLWQGNPVLWKINRLLTSDLSPSKRGFHSPRVRDLERSCLT